MEKSRIFFLFLSVFICGVFVRSFWEIGPFWIFAFTILALAASFVFYRNKRVLMISAASSVFIASFCLTDNAIEKTKQLSYAGKTLAGEALVTKVALSDFGQNVTVQLVDERISALVRLPQYPTYKYGDLLDLTCVAKAVENRDSEFDYRMYLAKEGVLYTCDKPQARRIAEGKGDVLLGAVFRLRALFEKNINNALPQPAGALAAGLLFGGSEGLTQEIKDDFSRTGMTHVVAVSGYNVTIIAEYLILTGIFLGLWRKKAIWFALGGICLFVIMSGMPASAVRAGVMGGTLLWAVKNGRLANCENAIILAGAVMLLANPLLLRWDIGFQLSFLATLGIVKTSPFWERSFVKRHRALGVSEVIAFSLSAQIFVLPIIAYNFHMTSLISLLANVFILPVIPFSMLLVFLLSLASLFSAGLAMPFAWLAFMPLAYELGLIKLLAQFPWASIDIEKVTGWEMVLYYACLVLLLRKLERSRLIAEQDFSVAVPAKL